MSVFNQPGPVFPIPRPRTGNAGSFRNALYDFKFVNMTTLDPRITFSRASVGTYFDGAGVLQTAASGLPRFDHDPSSVVTNQVFTSTTPGTGTGWSTNLITVAQNAGTAPDGSNTATSITDNSTSGQHVAYTTLACAPTVVGQKYTGSVYAKAGTSNQCCITLWGESATPTFTLTGSGSCTAGATIQPVGNGWYWCSYTWTRTTNANDWFFLCPNSNISGYVGTGQNVLFWGPQLQIGGTLGNYVPTSGAAASSTATPLGLLIEPATINSLTNSGAPATQYGPGVVATTITAASGTAPDGTNTMAALAETTATGSHYAQNINLTVSASSTQTFSVFAKANTDRYLQLIYDDNTNGCYATFDLIGGTVSQAVAARGTGTATASGIQNVGNGTYRCWITGIAGTATTVRVVLLLSNSATPGFAPSYTGVATNNLLVWGSQLEQNSFPTSYIPTTASAVTRNSDVANATLGGLTATQGTLAAEFMAAAKLSASNGYIFAAGNVANGCRIQVATTNSVQAVITRSGTLATLTMDNLTVGQVYKAASTYLQGTCAASDNGAAVVTATSANTPASISLLCFGQIGAGNVMCGWLRRCRYWNRVLSNTELQFVTTGDPPSLDLSFLGGTLDSRISFSRSGSGATYFDKTGTLQVSAANTPRFDYDPSTLLPRGLLIEEARTNSIRNSTMVGAVAGTPGTWPTNWSVVASGCSTAIIGSGTQNGIPYLDVRFYSASTTSTFCVFEFETSVTSAAAVAWTESVYIALVGGTLTNITGVDIQLRWSTGANADNTIVPTTSLTRYSNTGTSPTGTTGLWPAITVAFANAAAIDCTLRFGAPQLEQAAFATSFIPTTNATVTRAKDIAQITPLGSWWFSANAGTLDVEWDSTNTGTNPTVGGFSSGAFTNTLYLNGASGISQIGGTGTTATTGSVNYAGLVNKQAATYAATTLVAATNGAVSSAQTIAAGPYPWTTNLSIGCSPWGLDGQVDGHIRRVRYWPRALSAGELAVVTT